MQQHNSISLDVNRGYLGDRQWVQVAQLTPTADRYGSATLNNRDLAALLIEHAKSHLSEGPARLYRHSVTLWQHKKETLACVCALLVGRQVGGMLPLDRCVGLSLSLHPIMLPSIHHRLPQFLHFVKKG